MTQSVKKQKEKRQTNIGKPTGVFTGAFAINPINQEKIPIWLSEYVLHGYGTGAVMAVPSGDQRDHDFAKHFNIDIKQIFENQSVEEEAYIEKDVKYINSEHINGLTMIRQ